MIDVVRVYNIVRDIANKDQKGFVTPNVFNSFAQVAQNNVYNEMFNELKMASALRKSGRDAGRDKSAYKMVEQDLSTFIVNLRVVEGTAALDEDLTDPDNAAQEITSDVGSDSFTFTRPTNMNQDISMSIDGGNTSVEMIYDAEKVNRILNSNLSGPTDAFPVCFVMGNVYQVSPSPDTGVILRYYRKPLSRFYSGLEIGEVDYSSPPTLSTININENTGQVLPDPGASRNFDLPPHYMSEVVYEICELIGISLRDPLLVQYAMGETKAE